MSPKSNMHEWKAMDGALYLFCWRNLCTFTCKWGKGISKNGMYFAMVPCHGFHNAPYPGLPLSPPPCHLSFPPSCVSFCHLYEKPAPSASSHRRSHCFQEFHLGCEHLNSTICASYTSNTIAANSALSVSQRRFCKVAKKKDSIFHVSALYCVSVVPKYYETAGSPEEMPSLLPCVVSYILNWQLYFFPNWQLIASSNYVAPKNN